MSKNPLEEEVKRLERKFGYKAAALGSAEFQFDAVPTGSLALDYALGTGGWPLGHPVEVFGQPDVGKSSIIGFSAIRNAQAMGKLCAIIAVEPGFDKEWAVKNGVDPDMLIVVRPNDGEEAFNMLYDFVSNDIIDFIVFDSIGAILRPSEAGADTKPSQGGAAVLIAHGIKNILQPTWKNRKGVIFLNQVRDNMRSPIPGSVESPGGWAVKHAADIRVHLKAAGVGYKEKIDGEDVVVGRPLVAIIKRNKLSEGSDKRAKFDYYQMETENHEIGIDGPKDVRQVAVRTQVFNKSGGWHYYDNFPDGKLNGEASVDAWLKENPSELEKIRGQVFTAMIQRNKEAEEKDGE